MAPADPGRDDHCDARGLVDDIANHPVDRLLREIAQTIDAQMRGERIVGDGALERSVVDRDYTQPAMCELPRPAARRGPEIHRTHACVQKLELAVAEERVERFN